MKIEEIVIGQRYLSILEGENLVFTVKKISRNNLDVVGEIEDCLNAGGIKDTQWGKGVPTIFFIDSMREIEDPVDILKQMIGD